MDQFSESNEQMGGAHREPDEPIGAQEVYADLDQPFEKPAKDFVAGALYKGVEEVLPELKESSQTEEGAELAIDRRDFMRLFSASALLGAAACVRRPEEKAIPYVNQPVDQVVGVATHYASTCGECYAGCGVMVKTREGRPVKIEGSAEHPISQGATCALGQSALQALYHPERRKKPVIRIGSRRDNAEWEEVFERLGARIANAKNIGILTGGATGHRHKFFEDFLAHHGQPKTNLYTYESNGLLGAITKAHQLAFEADGIPRYDLRAADLIVGIGSDFLDVGISPVYQAKSFAASHNFRMGKMGRLIQFESYMSNTGGRARERFVIPPGSELAMSLLLVRALLKNSASKGSSAERAEIERALRANQSAIDNASQELGEAATEVERVASELLGQKSIVICGSTATDENATALQLVAIMANVLIGAYGTTLFFDRGWANSPVRTEDLSRFLENADKLDVLIIIDSNPAFTIPSSFDIEAKVKKIGTVVSIQSQNTETDALADFVLPGRHYLESWGDEESVAGFWSVRQPTIRPITDSRQAEDILLWVSASVKKPMKYREYREYLMQRWQSVYALMQPDVTFDTFWKAVLRRGFVGKLSKRNVRSMAGISGRVKLPMFVKGSKLISPLDIRLNDGRGADRPVLQEAGDAMTTIAWDSWVAINPKTAKSMGFRRNDVLLVESASGKIEVPLYPLPGLHSDAVVVHRGNGRVTGVNKVTDGFGVNPLPLLSAKTDELMGYPVFANEPVRLSATGKRYTLAALQKHNDIANRSDIIKKVTLADATANMSKKKDLDNVPNLYPKLKESPDYRWGMAIDFGACTGCSACMVACATENNVAQVGRKQILNGREMHWIRLDRYFAGPVDNPEVSFQPMLCQHCNHAPCEAVCPVYATSHDPEGFNGQTYNRCIGTRYCANACPYKVRRFNWFTHKWNIVGDLERDRNLRALNPDVTVRTRGVMEKCSFCIQRVRDAKHRAKDRGDLVKDGEIRTACQQVCPTNAIVFGNLKDPRSLVTRMRTDARAFLALNGDPDHGHYGLKTMPNVSYLAEVTIKESAMNKGGHHAQHQKSPEEHG